MTLRFKYWPLIVLMLLSVQVQAQQNAKTFLVSAVELSESDPSVIVLHVGMSSDEFTSQHIRGARFLDLNRIAPSSETTQRDLPAVDSLVAAFEQVGVSDQSRVVLYDTGNGLSAARAFFTLDIIGFGNAALLDGGFAAWASGAFPIGTGPSPSVFQGSITAQFNPDLVRTASQVQEELSSHYLIDARSAGEYSGETPGNTITRGGHIPGAAWLDSSSHLQEDGLFKPLEALVELYKDADGKPTIVYCRTGMKASQSYFVARMLGLDVAMYDGSFFDWSNQTEYDVEKGN